VLWDLDNEARETAERLGLTMVRAGTAGTHPAFVQMMTLAELPQLCSLKFPTLRRWSL
jgi:protoheme ferro-lyase